jgi:succinyl-CoA synthetase beta subunit
MRLLEFQVKRLLSMNGISVPVSTLVMAPEDLAGLHPPVVLKAQVPLGGRGKAGLIRTAHSRQEAAAAFSELMGLSIDGHAVSALLAEALVTPLTELYLAVLIDKRAKQPMLMASTVGGVDIESVTRKAPETLIRAHVDLCLGLPKYATARLAKRLSMQDRADGLRDIVEGMLAVFETYDATLVEINPLAVTDEALVALDAKVVLDAKAAELHAELYERLESEQEEIGVLPSTGREKLGRQMGLMYVDLGGDIAMISDGAGTGLLTLDLIRDAGGEPACFCELGAKADAKGIQDALELVFHGSPPRALVISLIGGLTRMDELANGIAEYLRKHDVSIPLAVRMCGTREEEGREILHRAGVDAHEDLEAVVQLAVDAAGVS